MTDMKDAVARGVALLDEEMGEWVRAIDLDTLNLADECDCVLGQLGDYNMMLDELDDSVEDYKELTRLWYDVIDERQKAKG